MFAAGGSGGHIFPALEVAKRLPQDFQAIFICSRNQLDEKILANAGVEFFPIFTGKLRRYFSWENFLDLLRFPLGILQSLLLLWRIRPKAIFSKGGFASLPVCLAGWVLRIRVILHESDWQMGLANRVASKFAHAVLHNFAGENVVGLPVAREILNGKSRRIFPNRKPLIFCVGGSQGAGQINSLVRQVAGKIPANFIVQTGRGKNIFQEKQWPNLRAFEFLTAKQIGDFLHSCQVVVSRAGASFIAEIAAAGKPLVLLPLPGHQSENAKFLKKSGAARIATAQVEHFQTALQETLGNKSLQKSLAKNLHSFFRADSAKRIAAVVVKAALP